MHGASHLTLFSARRRTPLGSSRHSASCRPCEHTHIKARMRKRVMCMGILGRPSTRCIQTIQTCASWIWCGEPSTSDCELSSVPLPCAESSIHSMVLGHPHHRHAQHRPKLEGSRFSFVIFILIFIMRVLSPIANFNSSTLGHHLDTWARASAAAFHYFIASSASL